MVEEDFAVTCEVQNASIYLGEKFIGRIAELYPSLSGEEALRKNEDKVGALTGTKGYLWRLFSDYQGKRDVDMGYFRSEIDKAYKKIEKVGDPKEITDYKPE
ncbi:Uncharacterised protein [Chlamydia trachomatis]|nr:Uncharacterised protein [Chlamydia trachomatis]